MQSIEAVKQNIKERLAIVWDKSEHEVEELIKFDPVVRLLFNAVVFRYEDVFDQQALYKKEVMGDLAKRLIPDQHFTALPAFGVLEARPQSKNTIKISTGKMFTTSRNINNRITTLAYTPLSETKLAPVQLALLVGGGISVDLLEKAPEKRIANMQEPDENGERSMWFGLDVPKGGEAAIDSLRFFVNYPIDKNENRLLFEALSEGSWVVHGKQSKAQKGFNNEPEWDSLEESNAWEVVKKRVNSFYLNNFISIKANKKQGTEPFNPPKLSTELQKKYKNLLWVKVDCACAMPIDFFLNNMLSFNAFPVVNCKVKKGFINRAEPVKVFDLDQNEHFLTLLGDRNSNSDFIIRNQRFNSFDAKDLASELHTVERLFDQARVLFDTTSYLDETEVNVFHSFADIVSDVSHKLKKQGVTIPVNIATKHPLQGVSTFNYLTTYGKWGNGGGIKDVFSYDSPGIDDKSIKALTTFGGGKDPLKEEEMIDRFRYQLLSRDRIVTREDIRALCYLVFDKENIDKVEISKTTQCGVGDMGLHRGLKVIIQLNRDSHLPKQIIDFKQKELLAQLESKSVGEWGFVVEVRK